MRAALTYFVLLFFFSWCSPAQADFFKLYKQVDDFYKRVDKRLPMRKGISKADTVEIISVQKLRSAAHKDSVPIFLKHLDKLSFPDISFTDMSDRDHSVSDFRGSDLIINYTYLYCMRCVRRIDSTLKLTASKNVKLLVLVSDAYRKDVAELLQEAYGEQIMIGLINEDNIELITLKQGDDCMYYLNAERQIEFFDKLMPDYQQAWLSFLEERFK